MRQLTGSELAEGIRKALDAFRAHDDEAHKAHTIALETLRRFSGQTMTRRQTNAIIRAIMEGTGTPFWASEQYGFNVAKSDRVSIYLPSLGSTINPDAWDESQACTGSAAAARSARRAGFSENDIAILVGHIAAVREAWSDLKALLDAYPDGGHLHPASGVAEYLTGLEHRRSANDPYDKATGIEIRP